MGSAQAGIALRGGRTPVHACDLRHVPAGADRPYGLTDDYLYLAQAEELGLPSPPYTKSVLHAAVAEAGPSGLCS